MDATEETEAKAGGERSLSRAWKTITRRRFLSSALAAESIVALAGCGRVPDEPTTVPDPTPQPPTETPTGTGSPETPTPTSTPKPERIVYAGFLDSDEIAAIRRKLNAREAPWYGGYRVLLKDADRALGMKPKSVVANGAPEGVRVTQFATDDDDRTDYLHALAMSHWIRDLGLAYAFSGEDRYAKKAIELLDHWCLNPRTRMEPSGKNHGAAYFSIELHITIPAMIYGASLVAGHESWATTVGGEAAFNDWVRAYLDDLEAGRGLDRYTGVIRNNIYAWWILARAVAGAYLHDQNALRSAFHDWQTYALEQLQPDGALLYERQREDGLLYSLYGLKALTLTAEIARHYDVNLYECGSPDNPAESALRRAFGYFARYVERTDGWAWGFGDDGYTDAEREEGASVYELAYSQWGDVAYLDAIEAVGRPVNDRRILGWTTLTHANRFAL